MESSPAADTPCHPRLALSVAQEICGRDCVIGVDLGKLIKEQCPVVVRFRDNFKAVYRGAPRLKEPRRSTATANRTSDNECGCLAAGGCTMQMDAAGLAPDQREDRAGERSRHDDDEPG